jgi:hypothetical protein
MMLGMMTTTTTTTADTIIVEGEGRGGVER